MNNLKQARKYLNSIPNINRGGCAISVLAMYRFLKKKKVKAKITIVFGAEYANRLSKILANKIDSCDHVALKYNNMLIDSSGTDKRGTISLPECFQNQVELNEPFVVECINSINDWNSMFDRNYVKHIQHKLDIDLSDIKIN